MEKLTHIHVTGSDRVKIKSQLVEMFSIRYFCCFAVVKDLEALVSKLTCRVSTLEKTCAVKGPSQSNDTAASQPTQEKPVANEKQEQEEDFELFGSDNVSFDGFQMEFQYIFVFVLS